ncbi:MAG TPA: heme-binding protein [Steroidobacteraceae bacterium]|nr:heme-binding protein [Steroidobacteraceae bacterium]
MLTRHTLSLDDAKAIAGAAASKARKEGWTVVIAILDSSGHLQYLERADGTQLGSVTVAQEKARTALMFRRPSQAFEEMILSGKTHMMGLPGVTPVAGGLPLSWRGEIVGAIGVSGVLSSQDAQVAQAGAAVLSDAVAGAA